MGEPKVEYRYVENFCILRLPLHPVSVIDEKDDVVAWNGRRVVNIKNCDMFIDDFNFLMYADVQLFKFHSEWQFNLNDKKHIFINFNTKARCFELILPINPPQKEEQVQKKSEMARAGIEESARCDIAALDLWKFKRITDKCFLQLDDICLAAKFEAHFDYGFASKFKGRIYSGDCDLSYISRMPEPHLTSPLKRAIDREIDELKNFSREQYKLNFIELQVPEGHENPTQYDINFNDIKLTLDQEHLLHNLTCRLEQFHMPDAYDKAEVDCGLLSILLAICYDVRSTCNELTCESAWTRSILSPMLIYFEPFTHVKEVLISFVRRSLIYPLYRNYDFGIRCVQDAIEALQKNHRQWILKQLLVTQELFSNDECGREIFNRYYIDDYIRYFMDEELCTSGHLEALVCNMKNALIGITKKHIRLDLLTIETELLKEIISDMNIPNANGDNEEEEEDEDEGVGVDDNDRNNDDDTKHVIDKTKNVSLASMEATNESSIIEKRIKNLKI